MKTRKWRMGGVLLAAVILVGAVTGMAFANPDPQEGFSKANLFQNFVSKFAANLGVDQDKVTAAMDTTKKQMLDEAVQQGNLTQEQADKIAARKDFGFGGMAFHQDKGREFKKDHSLQFGGVANALGMTDEEFKAELQAGKKIQDIVAEHGMTTEEFRQKMQEIKKEAISKMVTDGKITQDQADKMIQRMDQRLNHPGFDKEQ